MSGNKDPKKCDHADVELDDPVVELGWVQGYDGTCVDCGKEVRVKFEAELVSPKGDR